MSYSFDRVSKLNKKIVKVMIDDPPHPGTVGEECRHAQGVDVLGDVMDPLLFKLFGGRLIDVMKDGILRPRQETIYGHRCWRVDVPKRIVGSEGQTMAYSIWLDPAIGWNPRRTVWHLDQKGSTSTGQYIFTDYRQIGAGVYFPMRIINRYGKSPVQGMVMKAQEAACGKPVSKDEVSIVFPSGTKVTDPWKKTEYTVP